MSLAVWFVRIKEIPIHVHKNWQHYESPQEQSQRDYLRTTMNSQQETASKTLPSVTLRRPRGSKHDRGRSARGRMTRHFRSGPINLFKMIVDSICLQLSIVKSGYGLEIRGRCLKDDTSARWFNLRFDLAIEISSQVF
jgi:hypothetical protein